MKEMVIQQKQRSTKHLFVKEEQGKEIITNDKTVALKT